jgi:putative tryptophan/tyrosine transport system substrate-binding protein
MRRREFISLVGGAAAAWPLAAQQLERMRRIGVLMAYGEGDAEGQSFTAAFVHGLQELGWTNGRNLRIDYRWAAGDVERMRAFAKELVELQPDAIVAHTTPVTAAVQRTTRTIPVVMAAVSDPVGDGFVPSLSRPGGNITGFINIESSMGGKWLELVNEIAPRVRRAAIMFNPDTAPARGAYFLDSFETAAQTLAIEPIKAAVRSDADIIRAIEELGRVPGGGLVATADGSMTVHRATIISQAARNNVPAVYHIAVSAKDGGLLSYGASVADIFYRCAPYIDRILHGARPADLPVQIPTKFEFVINLKTAKALGLEVPARLLARADEVIE